MRHVTFLRKGQHLLVASQPIQIVERRVASKHFKDDATEAPPISCASMPTILDHFWAHVERTAHGGVSAAVLLHGQQDTAVEITHTNKAKLIK